MSHVDSLENYHLRCWTCGITHITARWKSLKVSKCAYTQLASGKQVADIERIPLCARVIPRFEQYLRGLNRREDRRAHHWPVFIHNEGNYQLKCTKCGVTYSHHKKHLMLRASCSKSLQEKVLCKEQIAQDIPIPTKLIQPGGLLLRGGLLAKVASLNLGTLKDKQEMLKNLNIDVFALQETCVPIHRRTATTKAFRACGATITYAHVSEGDVRKRGRREGVRLGSGLSCVAFEPWQVHAVDSTLPNTPERKRCQHRLHTSVVTNGSTYILLHNLYMSPYENPGLLRDLVDTLAVAIQAYPHSYHIIAGDWQQPATHTSFGGLLLDAGWVPHESLYGHAPTNHPYAGAARRLDELWISPTLAHYVSGVGQGRYAGFSTHELLQVSFRFEEQAIIGKKLPKGQSQDECAKLLREKTDSVWAAQEPNTEDPQSLFEDWHRKFCAWLRIPAGKVGLGREKVAVDDREAKAPVKAAVMYKQNIARKVGEWLREIRFLLDKEVWGPVREARVESLLRSLGKAPWIEWCGLVGTPVPENPREDSVLQRSQYWVEWAEAYWDTIHPEVIRQARHALSKWKLSVRDNLSNSDLTKVSRWIKAHNTQPVLRTDGGEFVSHPHLVGSAAHRSLARFLWQRKC